MWNKGSLTHKYNPLNMFLSYHIIDRLFSSTAKLVNTIGIHTAYADPTDWVSTLLDFSTIKLEKVYRPVDPAVEYPPNFMSIIAMLPNTTITNGSGVPI